VKPKNLTVCRLYKDFEESSDACGVRASITEWKHHDGEQHLKNLNVMMNGEDFKGVTREIENNHNYG